MKAVILAAGLSSRIRSITQSPKCLLNFDGHSIIDYQLNSLVAAGVDEFAIVLGYKGGEIVEHVAEHHAALMRNVTFLTNSLFASTNNIYSLYMAREWIGCDSTICLNADVLYHSRIILPAVQTLADISMIVDPGFREETMKVVIRDGHVVEMRKGIPREQSSGTYIGVTTFAGWVVPLLMSEIENLIRTGHERDFFNVAVQRLVAKGVKVSYTSTRSLPWAEVDDPADYEFAQQFDWAEMHGLAEKLHAPALLTALQPTIETQA